VTILASPVFLSQVQEGRLLFQRHRFFCCFAVSFLPSQGKPATGWSLWMRRKRGTFDPQTWPADHLEKAGYNLDNPIVLSVSPSLELGPIAANVAPLD